MAHTGKNKGVIKKERPMKPKNRTGSTTKKAKWPMGKAKRGGY